MALTEENLERYLKLAARIYERIKSNPTTYALFKELIAEEERPLRKSKAKHS
jgi:hypothetical protein